MHARVIWLAVTTLSVACGQVRGGHDAGPSNEAGTSGRSSASAGATGDEGGNAGSTARGGADDGASGAGSDGATVVVQPTWRLTNVELANSVQDLLGIAVKPADLEPDSAVAGYSVGLPAGRAAVLAYRAAVIQIASAAKPTVPCTATEITADGAACAAKFVDAFAPKVFRRPLEAGTRSSLLSFHAAVSARFGFEAGIRALLERMLQSPYFLYHLELEEHDLGLGQVPVSGYSMASRLSYLLWSSTPDDELLAEAAAGRLTTAAQVRAQAERLLQDERHTRGLRNFYEQWLAVRAFPSTKGGAYASYGPEQWASILGSFQAQADTALWSDGGLTRLLSGAQAFADPNTAPLLGVASPAPGMLTPGMFAPVTVDGQQRLGILTHPAIMGTLATTTTSDPMRRAAFVWDRILCQPLPDHPPDVPRFQWPTSGSLRQALQKFDSASLCQTCHARLDSVGFLFESYDALGAFRTVDDTQNPVAPATTIVGVEDARLNGDTANAVAFSKRLAASDQVSRCLTTHLFRYASKRQESDADRAFLASLATEYTQSGQGMKQLLAALTQSAIFLQRINEN